MCETLQGFHEHYSRMAIVGVTSELLVVLGFWAIYFRDKDEQRGSSPTIDDYLKAPAHPFRQTGKCRSTINVHQDGEVIPVVGVNPLLLFDANRVLHSAPAPIRGCRPTVEFTLMPQGFSKYQLLQAGFQAGYPVNPFKSYSHAYTMLYSQ